MNADSVGFEGIYYEDHTGDVVRIDVHCRRDARSPTIKTIGVVGRKAEWHPTCADVAEIQVQPIRTDGKPIGSAVRVVDPDRFVRGVAVATTRHSFGDRNDRVAWLGPRGSAGVIARGKEVPFDDFEFDDDLEGTDDDVESITYRYYYASVTTRVANPSPHHEDPTRFMNVTSIEVDAGAAGATVCAAPAGHVLTVAHFRSVLNGGAPTVVVDYCDHEPLLPMEPT